MGGQAETTSFWHRLNSIKKSCPKSQSCSFLTFCGGSKYALSIIGLPLGLLQCAFEPFQGITYPLPSFGWFCVVGGLKED